MRSEEEVPFTFTDFIRTHGAMKGLMSHTAKAETSPTMQAI